MSPSEIPSKATIRTDLQRRLESVTEQMREFDDLRIEKRELEAAIAALGGGVPTDEGNDVSRDKPKRKRGTRAQVEARRDSIARMLSEDSSLSIAEVAEAVDVSYQTAANDIKLLRESGHPL